MMISAKTEKPHPRANLSVFFVFVLIAIPVIIIAVPIELVVYFVAPRLVIAFAAPQEIVFVLVREPKLLFRAHRTNSGIQIFDAFVNLYFFQIQKAVVMTVRILVLNVKVKLNLAVFFHAQVHEERSAWLVVPVKDHFSLLINKSK